MEFPELELLKLSNRTNIDFKSLMLIDENIIKDYQIIDNEIINIDQSTWNFDKEIEIIFNSSTIFNQQLLPIYVSSVPFHVV